MTALASLLAGCLFGLSLAAPPGPMNAVIAEESVRRGWAAGVRAGLGAATADALFFVLALLGVVTFVERFPTVRAAMVGAGGLLMLYFAYGAARDLRGSFRRAGADGADRVATGFRRALALALTNPYQVLFWLTVGVGLLDPGTVDPLARVPYAGDALAGTVAVRTGGPALVAGFFGGVLLWIVAFPAALATARRRVEAVAPAVAGLSAVVLAGFGLAFLSEAAGALLS